MDFNDSPEEAEFRAAARAFLDANVPLKGNQSVRMRRRDPASYLAAAKAYQKAKAEAGFAGITWPETYGGRGLAPIFHVIFAQEEERFDAPSAPFAIGLGMCLPTMIAFANEAQKARHCGPALRGEEIWCQLFSEPSAGSDVAASRTRAVRDGDEYVINGQKVWTTGAHISDWGLLLVRTDPDKPKHKGLSMVFLDMTSPGVEVAPIHQMSGGSDFNEVYFTDVRIPADQVIGGEGNGWPVALVTLMNERLAVGGSLGPDYEEIIELARLIPTASGRPLIEDGAFRERLADWVVRAEGYKLGKCRAMTALSRGETPGAEASLGKILNATRMQEISNQAIEAMDLFGILTGPEHAPLEGAFQAAFFWAAGLRIAGGTDEVLKNILAERVLGLPADPRIDKDAAFKDLPA